VLPDKDQDVQDRVAVKARDSFDGAHGHAFYEQAKDYGDVAGRQVGSFQPFRPVGVGLAALAALEALITAAVASKLLALASAIMAGHFGLSFPQSKPIMGLSVGIAAYSAC
jgi:hypothetical protein